MAELEIPTPAAAARDTCLARVTARRTRRAHEIPAARIGRLVSHPPARVRVIDTPSANGTARSCCRRGPGHRTTCRGAAELAAGWA